MKIIQTITDPDLPDFGQVIKTDLPDPPKTPLIMSKTAFQDYAIRQLGGGPLA